MWLELIVLPFILSAVRVPSATLFGRIVLALIVPAETVFAPIIISTPDPTKKTLDNPIY